MDKRRLQRTGGASLTVTLPKNWISVQHLHGGDSITMHQQTSGTLLLKAAPENSQEQPVILNIGALSPETITREAVALYIMGVNEIEFQQKDLTLEQRSHIRAISGQLIGFEIVNESSDSIVIRNILDIAKLPIADVIDKMFLVSGSMLSDAIDAAIKDNKEAALDITNRDLEVDKLYLIINRQFHSLLDDRISEEELHLTRLDVSYYRTVALQIERIADHAVRIAETVRPKNISLPHTKSAMYKGLMKDVFELMQSAQQCVKNFDRPTAHQILNSNPALEKTIARLSNQTRGESSLLFLLQDSLDRVRGYIMNIAEATIDYSIHEGILL